MAFVAGSFGPLAMQLVLEQAYFALRRHSQTQRPGPGTAVG